MKDQIQIVSWLLTRQCNLKCSYCAIVRNYKNMPPEYPRLKHYIQNEMDTQTVISILGRLKKHNPDCFMIFYGGEPMLRADLPDIINYCNKEDIHYTIISNNTDEIQPQIERLFSKTDYVTGFTSSVDPLIITKTPDDDRVKKCMIGMRRLADLKKMGLAKDVVAEITVDNNNVPYLHQLVKDLTSMGINSDITFVDIAKNPYYDFSNVTDKSLLVSPTKILKKEMNKIIDDKLDVHMSGTLLKEIYTLLPSELNCRISKNIHNMTIDADGSVRLCLRIRGTETPKHQAMEMLRDNGSLHPALGSYFAADKNKYCRGCNWTCMIMSKLTSLDKSNVDDLVHKDRR